MALSTSVREQHGEIGAKLGDIHARLVGIEALLRQLVERQGQ